MESTFSFKSSTGFDVFAKKWINNDFKEHKGRYNDFANFLANNGYIVVGHDHLGHGNTAKCEDDFGYFADNNGWDRLVEDVHILQNKVHNEYPNLPYIVMGHSMGSLIVRTYITKYDDNLTGVIISGTSGQKYGLISGKLLIKIISTFKGKRYKSKLIEHLVTGSFNKKFEPNRTPSDWICSDENEVNKFIEDEKCGKMFSVQAYYDLLSGTQYLSKQKNVNKTVKVPILIFSGDEDPVGQNGKGVLRVYKMLKKDGTRNVYLRLFKNARHELLNEVNKLEVYNFILDWLDKL